MTLHRVAFVPRAAPLEATAVLVEGDAMARLLKRLADRTRAELVRLRAVRGEGLMVVLGATEALPWCEGARYYGVDPACTMLLLPVELEPDVPAAWLRSLAPGEGAHLLVPRAQGVLLVPLDQALPLDPECLTSVAS